MKKPRVAVIGAGPSGITALKNLLDADIDTICLEANSEVGGNWLYSEEESHSSVFESTHIISSKALSHYKDFPWVEFDETTPHFPSHWHMADYFKAYAKRFGLYNHIRFNSRVKNAVRLADEKWVLTIENQEQTTELEFTHLVVCNGHHWSPRQPNYPGEFAGQLLHSHQFKKAAPFADKRVLVIGGGNSACEVAIETSKVSARTDMSWRRGYWITPRFVRPGLPSDVAGRYVGFLPPKIWSFLGGLRIRLRNGPNRNYGLPDPDGLLGSTHPITNDEILEYVRSGRVRPKKDVERLEGHHVHFVDGTKEEYDTVIACTGFVISHPFFDRSFVDYSDGDVSLYLKMMHPRFSDLYFVGLIQPLGCIWPLSELQSKLVAQEITGKWRRPSNIDSQIEKELRNPDHKQIKSPRHTITVSHHQYEKRLLRELGKAVAPRSGAKIAPEAV